MNHGHFRTLFRSLFALSLFLAGSPELLAQDIEVHAANPDMAEQGTASLDVTITGKGFENDADVAFILFDSELPGGITVNSVKVRGPKKLIANITVSEEAIVDDFNVEVTLRSSGRKGKGTTRLFSVLEKSTGTDLGQEISMTCELKYEWNEAGASDSLLSDTLGAYVDDQDKASCGVKGPSTPWPVRLWAVAKGNPKKAPRRIDVVLDESSFVDGTGPGYDGRDYLPDNYFLPAPADGDLPDWDAAETPAIQFRPYRDTQDPDGIHLLPPNVEYEVAMKMRLGHSADEDFRISVASRHWPGNEKFTGITCTSEDPQAVQDILNNAPGGPMRDVTVYTWPDANGNYKSDDGYTITTGAFIDYGNPPATLPTTIDEPRVAAICSAIGPVDCGTGGGFCNFLGYIDVQLTLHVWPH